MWGAPWGATQTRQLPFLPMGPVMEDAKGLENAPAGRRVANVVTGRLRRHPYDVGDPWVCPLPLAMVPLGVPRRWLVKMREGSFSVTTHFMPGLPHFSEPEDPQALTKSTGRLVLLEDLAAGPGVGTWHGTQRFLFKR